MKDTSKGLYNLELKRRQKDMSASLERHVLYATIERHF